MKPGETIKSAANQQTAKRQAAADILLVDCIRSFWLHQLEIIHEQFVMIDDGQISPEIIHDLRVAARRATSLAKLSQPFLAKGWAKDLDACLRPVRKATNELRDIDVLLARLQAEEVQDDTIKSLILRLNQERHERLARVLRKLSEKRFRKALSLLLEQLNQVDFAIELLRDSDNRVEFSTIFSLGDVRLALLSRQAAEISVFQHLTLSPSQLPAEVSADPELLAGFLEVAESTVHAIRLGVKDFRYVLEFLQPALETRTCSNLIRLCKRLQDQLGTIHDYDLAFNKLASLTAENPELQNQSLDAINKAWHQERQALLQSFLKRWYLMTPVWFERQLQAVVPMPGTTGATKVRAAN